MKILILGSKGMLGTDLLEELSKTNYEILGWDINDIDLTKEEHMYKIEKEKPNIIINCAAYTNVDLAETEKEKCYAVNVIGVKNLINISKKLDIPLIQISTDYMQKCLSFTIIEDTPNKLALKFTKCLWAKTFLENSASDIGHTICCNPDFAMAKSFHPNIKLVRTKSLMMGDDYCDSTYIWED